MWMKILSIVIIIGSFLNRIPYSWIPVIGKTYKDILSGIESFEMLTIEGKKEYIFRRVYNITKYAVENIKFYQDYYRKKGFCLSKLKSFDDIKNIPIINKSMLLDVPIEDRSTIVKIKGSFIANTGGSSGHPLSFRKTKNLQVKEFAYFHYMWRKIGYKKSDIRLHFVGRSNLNGKIRYNIVENSIQVDVYTPFDIILKKLSQLHCNIKYLHGYPSVLYEFALYCEKNQGEYIKSGLDKTLIGAFLKSEFPHPIIREKIEEVFKITSFSHYGHTEVCALAGEMHDKFSYDVMLSYGFIFPATINNETHLVTTTYDNFASPLIQYDTEDTVENCILNDGLLDSFEMTGGRKGEYVIDKAGKKISLTGLIFGNHHQLFDYCSQLQVTQPSDGKIVVLYVPKTDLPKDFHPDKYFATAGANFEVSFKKIDKPIKTPIGKVLLKVDYINTL